MGATGVETERKFLLLNDGWKSAVSGAIDMIAGYVSGNSANETTVICDDAHSRVVLSNKSSSYTFAVEDVALAHKLQELKQREPHCTVRVRMENDQAFLIFKGRPAADDPLSRPEYEVKIDPNLAKSAIDTLCAPDEVIAKIRHLVPFDGKTWEIDVFSGRNAGLIVAEIELLSADEKISLPPWVGKEVSLDGRYSNAALAKTPYSKWEKPAARPGLEP